MTADDTTRRPTAPSPPIEPSSSASPVDEELLSGYLDGELTQQQEQRVRVLLEDDLEARALFEDLATLRRAARGTAFAERVDDGWDERPRGGLSRWLRGLGWGAVIAWCAGLVMAVLWVLVTSPEPTWEKALVVGGVGGFVLLFLSVLVDRLRTARTDPYRHVKK